MHGAQRMGMTKLHLGANKDPRELEESSVVFIF